MQLINKIYAFFICIYSYKKLLILICIIMAFGQCFFQYFYKSCALFIVQSYLFSLFVILKFKKKNDSVIKVD